MDWQSIGAVGVALLCGVWVLWKFVQPFLPGYGGGCGSGCGSRGCGEEAPLDASGALLQIHRGDAEDAEKSKKGVKI